MGRIFKHLSFKDREKIEQLKSNGLSISEIARRIGKNKSTISRELKRNTKVETVADQLFWEGIMRYMTTQQLILERKGKGLTIPKIKRTWTAEEANFRSKIRKNGQTQAVDARNIKLKFGFVVK